jgi:Flp pilus assembly protein CpaB
MSMNAPAANKGPLGTLLGPGRTYLVLAIVFALAAMVAVFSILGNATATTVYWVLAKDVAARTQITPDMLVPVETSAGSQPRNAIDDITVSTEPLFSLVPLKAGDVVSSSVVGPLERINAGLPAGMSVASFQIAPEDAVAGKVRRGDLVDVYVKPSETGGDGEGAGSVASLALYRLLVLDVTSAPDSVDDSANADQPGANLDPGPESNAVTGGIPQIYTVAVYPEDAAKLTLIKDDKIFVTLSSNTPNAQQQAQADGTQIGNGPVKDSSSGIAIDPKTGRVILDEKGNPAPATAAPQPQPGG